MYTVIGDLPAAASDFLNGHKNSNEKKGREKEKNEEKKIVVLYVKLSHASLSGLSV